MTDQPMGNFVGRVGHRYRMPLRVLARIRYTNKSHDWLVIFDDKDCNRLVYWTNRDTLQDGREYEVEFDVVAHEVYPGWKEQPVRQTKIDNCKGKRIDNG